MAWWMEDGGVDSDGIKLFQVSVDGDTVFLKESGKFHGGGVVVDWSGSQPSRFALAFGIERFGGDFAVGFFEEDFYAAFGFFELLLAFAGKAHAFFKEFHGVVERELRAFEAPDDFFQASKDFSKSGFLGGSGFFDGSGVHVIQASCALKGARFRKRRT